MNLADRNMPSGLARGGPEQQAVEAGEIDAIVDHSARNVILLPAARRALREAARRTCANRLLAALPPCGNDRLFAGLEPVTLRSGEALHEPGAPIRFVYFPISCVIGLLAQAEGHPAMEAGLVGHEGMVGIPLALGAGASPVRALVYTAGQAFRMSAPRFERACRDYPSLQRELHAYIEFTLALAWQAIACNRFHPVDARLARHLLMIGDRARSEDFLLTQQFLAQMLGMRRATVSEAATSLQRRKLIGYRRGRIRILDHGGLEAASCGCYAPARGAYRGKPVLARGRLSAGAAGAAARGAGAGTAAG